MLDAYEFVKLQNELFPADTQKNYLIEHEGKQWTVEDYRGVPQYDWQDEIFRTAWQQSHNVSLMGGTEGYVTMRRLLISIRTVSCSTPTTNVSKLV